MTTDVRLLFVARALRMAAYGAVSVVLVLYLVTVGLDGPAIGAVLGLTLAGDVLVSLWLTTRADRLGRRRVLVAGAALMVAAGGVFAASDALAVLVVAAILGVISPSGREVGPFLAVEQAALAGLVPGKRRTGTFAWYNLVGQVAAGLGALAAGWAVSVALAGGASRGEAYRFVLVGYALVGLALAVVFGRLGRPVEADGASGTAGRPGVRLGLHRSRATVTRLAALFAVDALAGGFVMDSVVAYWLHARHGLGEGVIGTVLLATSLLAAASSLAAARIAARIGLVATMVVTHLPSNVLLIAVPLAPAAPLAVTLLLARSAISQMDVPTRQSYTMAVVEPDERSAAAGVTGIARSIGAAIGSAVAGPLIVVPGLASAAFFVGGGLKIVYDLTLWRLFRSRPAPEEAAATQEEGEPASR